MPKTKAPPAATPKNSASSKPPKPAAASKDKPDLKLVGGNALLLADKKTKANPDAMRRASKELGVEIPKTRGDKSTQELLGNLRVEIEKRLALIPIDEHMQCGKCREVALEKPSFCPFCGYEGDDPPVASAEVVEPDEEEEPEETEEETDEEPDDEASDDEEESVGITKGPAPSANIERATAELEKDLAARLEHIRKLKSSAVGLSYDIGIECREIRDKQLFRARGYKSFKDFAEKELPFTRESALQLIGIVEKHTRDDYEKIGYAKMRVIAAVSDGETKAELMAAARGGATTKQLTARAAVGKSAPPPAKSKTKAPEAEKGEKITLIGRIGARNQVMKFHNPDADGELVESAGVFKTVAPSLYGELQIADDVYLRVGLRVNDKKELEGLTVRFVRAADAAE